MKNNRSTVVVLVILLASSLALNCVLWSKSRHTGDQSSIASAPPTTAGTRESAPRERGPQSVYEIVDNPEMKGRLGRIVLAFAEGASIAQTRTAFHKAGESEMLRVDYGPVTAELPPGMYDLEVCEMSIAGVPVESGKDTRVRSGVLRLHGASQTRFVVHASGAKYSSHVAYGNAEFGLPAGEYEVEVSGAREKVTIEAGKVADF